ncbi:MAG: hypothetical protein MUF75_03440, partial [Bacteroidia bacterium]|nr:hypothetical protein [Bacteroidia bacterium]
VNMQKSMLRMLCFSKETGIGKEIIAVAMISPNQASTCKSQCCALIFCFALSLMKASFQRFCAKQKSQPFGLAFCMHLWIRRVPLYTWKSLSSLR